MIYFLSSLFYCTAFAESNDSVSKLPGWGDKYTGSMFAGYIPINESCNSALFYWMLEKEGGSEEGKTPVLLWLNGGPGASSVTGLMAENIGPYQLSGTKFKYNDHAWTNMYNVLIIDNPVGSGYSVTDDIPECYSSTEEEVAENFYIALQSFFLKRHKKYSTNPFYLTGESYAGKYIPNIAAYLVKMKFPFEGVVLGNGLYEPEKQYPTVPDYAFNLGIIDQETRSYMHNIAKKCADMIRHGDPAAAAIFCEDMVGGIYNDTYEDPMLYGVFRYNVQTYYNVFANTTNDLGKYLNSADVQKALYTTGKTWTQADETGPVADALRADFVNSVMPQLEILLKAGKTVILYNGQMDGSVCNHVGNEQIMEDIVWSGQAGFSNTPQRLWRVDATNAVGYKRVYKNLAFVMIANAGHLVPMNQPDNFRTFLDAAIGGNLTERR